MKNPSRDAQVVLAKCNQTHQPYGITVERQLDGDWHCVWAFKLSAKSASAEGYDDTPMSGRFTLDSEYPGCPYCGAQTWYICGCGKLNCWQGASSPVVCAWCGGRGEVQVQDSFDLRGGGF